MTFVCPKCTTSFQVGRKRGESTYCAAPLCGLRFWHVSMVGRWKRGDSGRPPAVVGITPEDYASFKATGEIAA